MEKLLVIAKPDLTIRRGPGALMLDALLSHTKAKVLASRKLNVSNELAESHYAVHKGKFFYDWLVRYLQCYSCIVFVIETEMPAEEVRKLLGSTLPQQADPESLRAKYALWAGSNGLHVSESSKAAEDEMKVWIDGGALKHGWVDFDLQKYIGEYKNGPNFTKELRRVMGRYAADPKSIDDAKREALNLLAKEAFDVKKPQLEKFNKLFWEGVTLKRP
ncbi:MAG: hypothetical protein KGH98_04810 [Candidatus Micrarchaeota archaeon]|nr:hypothetical protein [Candidatus Micrarchaeota archaeon]